MGIRKVLIVDDEKDIIAYLERLLEGQYETASALDGAEAISLFGKNNFDVVLTDVRMPGIDGIQVLKTIKKLSPDSEVILMTGYADLEVVIKALNEGAFAFVNKPLVEKVLLDRIAQAIAVIFNRESKDQAVQEMKQELLMQTIFAQKLSALAAMAGGIAHELHQPLSGISVYSDTVIRMIEKKRELVPATVKEIMEKINRQVDRSSKVIDHMREFSSPSGSDEDERLDLRKAIIRALELFKVQLQTHGIFLHLKIDPEVFIEFNRNRFEQVIINLISNSKDSLNSKSKKGASSPVRKQVEIKGTLEDTWVVMDISDNGGGVPEGLVDSIFEPFVTGKKETGGSGLGLFICRKVLEDSGASIDLISNSRAGSVFRLRFPAK